MGRSFVHGGIDAEKQMPLFLDDDFAVRTDYLIRVTDEEDLEIDVEIIVKYSERHGRQIASAVTGLMRHGGVEVTSTQLRSIRVQEYTRHPDPPVLWRKPDDELLTNTSIKMILDDMDFDPEQLKRDRYLWVSRIYRTAYIHNTNPVEVVANSFEISMRTATRWVKHARDIGLLATTNG